MGLREKATEGTSIPDDAIELKNRHVKKLLSNRGLPENSVNDVIDSFDGPIYASRGKAGDMFTVTETSYGEASGIFVTKGSVGSTPAERISTLALPPSNKALIESNVSLTRDQILLQGKVAPQLDWALEAGDGLSRNGGGWQYITNGGKYTDAIKWMK